MKIAVTSASGQLGSAVINQLMDEIGSKNVVGIARSPEKVNQPGIEIRKGDYNSRQELDIALKDINVVLLISGMDEPGKRIHQHRNVIEAAKINQVSKIVYTSIIGDTKKTAFSPIVQSNRQTEKDIQNCGLAWAIGRNGLYLEPDLEYINNYLKSGKISNCAGEGKCGYTSRKELGIAYTKMLIEEKHNGKIYNLVGEPISQHKLADLINEAFNTELVYNPISVTEYSIERKEELGDFLGTIIAGIYEGIKNGAFNIKSDFEKAAGRSHKSPMEIIRDFKKEQ